MRTRDTVVPIERLLEAKEGENYQFKEWKTKDDLKEASKICCALANCGGGKLVLGVSDKRPRKVVGSTAFPQPERTCSDLMNKLRIRIDFYILNPDNKRVLVIDVGSRPVGLPIQADGGAWWYQGDSLILMPEDVRHSIYSESGHDFTGDICSEATIDDLDTGAIEIFRNIWCEYSGNKRILTLSEEQLLSDAEVINSAGVTYAALILFGKSKPLLEYLPTAEIVFEYRSTEAPGPANQREDFREGFFNCYDRIWELVNLRNDKQHYLKRFAMLPVPTFNEAVVREALLNAASHRDYQLKGSIFVRQYPRKLIIENPGGFLPGITPENILNRHAARNGRIAAVFQRCGLVERSGQGMNLIYEFSVKEAKPLPNFTGSDSYFVKLALDGQVINTNLLEMLKKTDETLIEQMTTDDYILLSLLFQKCVDVDISQERFNNLIKLGIVRKTKLGFELAEGNLIVIADEKNNSSVTPSVNQAFPTNAWDTLELSDRQKQIMAFIANNGKVTTAQLAEYTGLSQGGIRKILIDLTARGLIKKNGDNRYAKYILGDING